MATIAQVLQKTAKQFAERPACSQKKNGHWQTFNWNEIQVLCRQLASALIEHQVQPGDPVLILSQNRVEWFVADIGAILAQAVPAGVYATSSPEQIAYALNHSQAPIIFVEDATQLAKVEAIKGQVPYLKHIISFESLAGKEVEDFWTWAKHPVCSDLDVRLNQVKEDDVATLVYTSGTTSDPKAVMLTHRNLTWMASAFYSHCFNADSNDSYLSYLPMSHVAEQMTTLHGPLGRGYHVYFAESIEAMPANLKEVRPTLFLGVPRVWEKIQEKIAVQFDQVTGVRKALLKLACQVGRKHLLDGDRSWLTTWLYQRLDKLVLKRIRQAIGMDRCHFALTGAAPISRDTIAFFYSIGITISEAYGMSETSGPISMSIYPKTFHLGSVGKAIPGSEVKTALDGEILVRGPHVSPGYLHNEEATKAAYTADGWFATGDTGSIDAQGFLSITGRKKNLIITAGGENIATELIEDKFKSVRGIEHAVAVGDQRKFISVLLTLDVENSAALSERVGSRSTSVKDLASCPKVSAYLEEEIHKINKNLARVQTIKKFTILKKPFNEAEGELTPTMKVKRNIVLSRYAEHIDSMYSH